MDNFTFRIGIESLIRFDEAHPILTNKKVSTGSANINLISHDPIKSMYQLDQTLEWQLLMAIKPKQQTLESLVNCRAYNDSLRKMIAKFKSRKEFPNLKAKKAWSKGVDNILELGDLQQALIGLLAMDIEV